MIKISKLTDYSEHYARPETRSQMLGQAALDYFHACSLAFDFLSRGGIPLWSFTLPTMHQSIELAAKAVAYAAIAGFDSKKHSHGTLKFIRKYAAAVPVFAEILQVPVNILFLNGLEQAYLGVRYGECAQSSEDVWPRFVDTCATLFDDLTARTGMTYPMALRGVQVPLDRSDNPELTVFSRSRTGIANPW